MALTDNFVQAIISCGEAYNAGSTLYIASYGGECSDEPILYTITNAAAVTAGDATIDLQLTAATRDGVAVTPLPDQVTLREGHVLTFAPSNFTVELLSETVITSAAAVTGIPIKDAENAIPATETAQAFSILELCSITDLPIASDSVTVNATVLKNGVQGSDVKTRVNLNANVSLISSPDDIAQQSILLPASQGTQDIYAVIVKSSGYVAFGAAKVNNWNTTGAIEELERITFALAYQAPFGLAYASVNPDINTASQLADLQTLFKYIGLPPIV